MIKESNAIEVFGLNMERTNMLIQAVEKISAYNYLYQQKAFDISSEYEAIVRSSQNDELKKIMKSCFEHAIISMATAFESYLKELVKELLSKYGDYFVSKETKWTGAIKSLINDSEYYENEIILKKLNLNYRFDIIKFFNTYGIVLLNSDQEKLIELIYIRRNNFVHCGSNLTKNSEKKMIELNSAGNGKYSNLSIKRIRTIFYKNTESIHVRTLNVLEQFQTDSHNY